MNTKPDPAAEAPGVFEEVGALEYPDRAAVPALVRVRFRGSRDRGVRAARTLAACWGLAVVAVLLPVLHFVLVPALLLLGPALAWSRLHEAHTLIGVDGSCPACARPLHETLGRTWRARTPLRCDGCSRPLTLVLPEVPGR